MDSYKRWRKVVKDNIGEITNIREVRKAMTYINSNNYKDSSRSIFKSVVKKLWWENHEYNKKNYADIEWEMLKYEYHRKPNYKKQHLSTNDIAKILLACRSKKQLLYMTFLIEVGCRISELTGLELSDCRINGDGVEITIKALKTGVTVYQRISFELYEAILKTFNGRKYLFETTGMKPYRSEYISNQIKKIGRIKGYDISAQSLSHYYVTNRINNGEDLLDISRSIGHKIPGSILNHSYTGKIKEAV